MVRPDDAATSAKPQPWASLVLARVALIATELENAMRSGQGDAATDAEAMTIERLLEKSRNASVRSSRGLWRQPIDRWRGTSETTAFVNLHAAEVLIIDLLSDDEVESRIPAALEYLNAILGPGDNRRYELAWRLRSPDPHTRRTALRDATSVIYGSADSQHARNRAFRNGLILSNIILYGIVALLILLTAWQTSFLPLCSSLPGTPSSTNSSTDPLICPSGFAAVQSIWDSVVVSVLGIAGATVVASLAIRGTPLVGDPYGLRLFVTLLKLPMGALFALIGIVALTAGLIPGFSPTKSSQILVYAFVFGMAQQIVTRSLDARVVGLLADDHAVLAAKKGSEDGLLGIDPLDLRSAVDESIQASLGDVLRRPVISNSQGSIGLFVADRPTDELNFVVEVRTGHVAWERARAIRKEPKSPGTSALLPFRLTGGEDRPRITFELSVDVPGSDAVIPPYTFDLDAIDDVLLHEISIPGSLAESPRVWAVLHSSGRYVQACRIEIDDLDAPN